MCIYLVVLCFMWAVCEGVVGLVGVYCFCVVLWMGWDGLVKDEERKRGVGGE